MRVCSIVLCLALCGATTATAQEAAFGVKGGINFSNLKFDGDSVDVNLDQRTGFVGGLFIVWPASGTLALQTEFLYSQKGATFDEEGLEEKVSLDYIDIPVLLRMSSRPAKASFHAIAGPSFGFKTRARSKSSFEGESHEEDIGDEVETFDLGLVLGAGLDFGRMTIDGRYTWGLTDISKESVDDVQDPGDDVKVKNRVFTVMVGVRF